jgi:Zn-dependent protease with chaperone function
MVTKMLRGYVGIEATEQTVQLFLHLPCDRQFEYEADHIAMVLMSKVGARDYLLLRHDGNRVRVLFSSINIAVNSVCYMELPV